MVSIVGWLDDHKDLAALWRGFSYLGASVWAVYFVGGGEEIKLGVTTVAVVGILGNVMASLSIAWLTNLYNFMDGTDGFAAVQAITVGIPAGVFFWLNDQYGLASLCYVIAAANTGFLFWNWSPAKIFMGDVSSCLIGFMFGILAIIGEITDSVYIYIWLILLAVFIWDATFTLAKRIVTGKKWYAAHRSHAYQRLTQMGISHARLTVSLLLFNVCILWPMAYTVYLREYLAVPVTLLSIIIMFLLWGAVQYNWSLRTEKGLN